MKITKIYGSIDRRDTHPHICICIRARAVANWYASENNTFLHFAALISENSEKYNYMSPGSISHSCTCEGEKSLHTPSRAKNRRIKLEQSLAVSRRPFLS